MTAPGPEWLLPHEAYRALRVGRGALGRWRRQGKIPAWAHFRTPGGHYRYSAQWLRSVQKDGLR